MQEIQYISETMMGMLDPDIKRVDVAGAIIFKNLNSDNGKLLIIKRAKDDHYPNHWEIPRGKVEEGEKIKKGLLREVKEETGLDVNILSYFNKFDYIVKNSGVIERISTQYNYICKMKDENQKVKLSFEHQDYKWISHDAEIELYLNNEIKQTVMMSLSKYSDFVLNPSYEYKAVELSIQESNIYLGLNY